MGRISTGDETWLTLQATEFARPVPAFLVMHLAFAFGAYAQEAASESAAQQRNRQRLIAPALPITILTNRDIGDLRLVQRSEPPPIVSVSTWQSLFYTDNVYRTEDDRRESLGWNGNISLQIVPYATSRWTPSISAEYFRFRYDRESAQDFDGQVLSFGSRLAVSQSQPLVWDLSYSLWRFVEGHQRSDEFFKEGLLENHLSWTHLLSSQPAVYTEVSYGVAFRHASPEIFDRLENEFIFSLHYFPWRYLQISGFIRPALRQYLDDDAAESQRNDLHFESGLITAWNWSRYFSARGEITWTWNDSNRPNQDYHVFEPQVSIFAQWGF